jgi:hypothetical protein
MTNFGLVGWETGVQPENKRLQAESESIGFIINLYPSNQFSLNSYSGGVPQIHCLLVFFSDCRPGQN